MAATHDHTRARVTRKFRRDFPSDDAYLEYAEREGLDLGSEIATNDVFTPADRAAFARMSLPPPTSTGAIPGPAPEGDQQADPAPSPSPAKTTKRTRPSSYDSLPTEQRLELLADFDTQFPDNSGTKTAKALWLVDRGMSVGAAAHYLGTRYQTVYGAVKRRTLKPRTKHVCPECHHEFEE